MLTPPSPHAGLYLSCGALGRNQSVPHADFSQTARKPEGGKRQLEGSEHTAPTLRGAAATHNFPPKPLSTARFPSPGAGGGTPESPRSPRPLAGPHPAAGPARVNTAARKTTVRNAGAPRPAPPHGRLPLPRVVPSGPGGGAGPDPPAGARRGRGRRDAARAGGRREGRHLGVLMAAPRGHVTAASGAARGRAAGRGRARTHRHTGVRTHGRARTQTYARAGAPCRCVCAGGGGRTVSAGSRSLRASLRPPAPPIGAGPVGRRDYESQGAAARGGGQAGGQPPPPAPFIPLALPPC